MLGVRSLLGHTVGGAAGAMSRITGAMGKFRLLRTFVLYSTHIFKIILNYYLYIITRDPEKW